jgi:hypothetical protein
VAEHGAVFEDELAEKYLAISDKTYLPRLVEKIVAKKDDVIRQAADDEAMRKKAIDPQLLTDYETAVRENYGRDPQFHKSVKSVVHYNGQAKEYIGGLMITLDDGVIILKSRTSQRNFRSFAEAENAGWL